MIGNIFCSVLDWLFERMNYVIAFCVVVFIGVMLITISSAIEHNTKCEEKCGDFAVAYCNSKNVTCFPTPRIPIEE